MHTIETNKKESEFIAAYLEAVDFTELGVKSPAYIGAEIDEDFLRESIIDCLAFYSRIACYLSDDNIALGRAGLLANAQWSRDRILG
jgi:hypothetical protein